MPGHQSDADSHWNRTRIGFNRLSGFLQKPADNNELMDVIRITLSPVWPGTTTAAVPRH